MSAGSESKYAHVANVLTDRIQRGVLKPDTPLPTLRVLMEEFGYSLATVTRAIEILERQSLVTRIHGKGIFVSGSIFKSDRAGAELLSKMDLRGIGGSREFHPGVGKLVIGVICSYPQPSRPAEMWWARLLRGVDAALSDGSAGPARVRLVPTMNKPPESIIEKCAADGINAVLILGGAWGGSRTASLYRAVRERKVPAVILWNSDPRPLCVSSVDVDSRRGIYDAVECLVGLGHKRLTFLGFEEDLSWVRERRLAFREITQLLGVETVPDIDLPLDVEKRNVATAADVLAASTAVVAANDDIAAWLINAAAGLGKTAPRHFSVVGFDDDIVYRHLELTTIHVDMERLGREAVRLLARLASDSASDSAWHLQIAGELVVRHTTGPAAIRR